jgi:hypothetical protein
MEMKNLIIIFPGRLRDEIKNLTLYFSYQGLDRLIKYYNQTKKKKKIAKKMNIYENISVGKI